jgi:DNA (cytosine-5)-methyltransferase 1
MKTFASLFSGFGGADVAAIAAGCKEIWGVEYDNKIADVARLNGLNVITADILDCDPNDFERPDILHASPPCPNFSNAKTGGEETPHDIALADKVAEFITVLLPDFFTLENVFGYRNSQSWEIIARALLFHGYQFSYWHVCTADFGVPQTRRRMIVIARRDGIRPMLPPATHAENPEAGLFGTLKRWVGWYEAIEDLIPGLPESKFAKWQLDRLPKEYGTILSCRDVPETSRHDFEPSNTVTADAHGKYRAFIVDDGNSKDGTVKSQERPMGTVRTLASGGALSRAFIVPGGNASSFSVRNEGEPARTVESVNRVGNIGRAYTSGRVVQMTTRCLARFQSFPDDYILPENKALVCRGIGNAVPPLFYQRLVESLL